MGEKIIETDVLVCGGGCSGCGAAWGAGRTGAKVILLERMDFWEVLPAPV